MPDEKDLIIAHKDEIIAELKAEVSDLKAQLAQMLEKLNMNSGNSSKPPSSDGLKKPVNKNRSLRNKSGRKPGGQTGHNGTNLAVLTEPDHIENHSHDDCRNCPHYEMCSKAFVKETRYVIDAVVDVDITAHNLIDVPVCPLCGSEKSGAFPDDIKAYIQYGDNLEALAVSLNTIGAVSVKRTHEILGGVFNIPISTGTISNMVSRCADKIIPVIEMIKSKLKSSPINHADGTGTNINGKTEWAHCLSNDKYTYIALHKKRGFEALKDIGILTDYHGILIHDCWSSYWKLDDVSHQLCCAHLLRELNGISENHPEQKWVSRFKELLLKMKHSKEKAVELGKQSLSKITLKKYSDLYDEIIELAKTENPLTVSVPGKLRKAKRGKIRCLVDRLSEHKGEVCLFINDLSVPFDNNQAERDIRNIKVKTKVSGFFKTEEGAENYLNIMSFVSTARKLGFSAFNALFNAVSGSIDMFLGLES